MDLKRLAGAATIAAGLGLSTLTFAVGPVNAAPMPNPSPSPTGTAPIPGGAHVPATAPTAEQGPHSGGGGAKSGGGGMTGKPAP